MAVPPPRKRPESAIASKLYKDYISEQKGKTPESLLTREYKLFTRKKTVATSLYEKLCQISGKIYKYPVNPDQKTYDFIEGTAYAPKSMEEAIKYWESIKSSPDAVYDDIVDIDASEINQVTTWGVNPAQSFNGPGRIPFREDIPEDQLEDYDKAMKYMGFKEGQEFYGLGVYVFGYDTAIFG